MSGKRLITDRDVLTGAVRPPLVLDGETLITPSARDRAVRLGWTIVEPGAAAAGATTGPAAPSGAACPRCGSGRCTGGCAQTAAAGPVMGSGSARLDTLADGLYLVRIESGRMVAALPAAGPGLMQRAEGARRAASDPARRGAGGDMRGGRT